MYDKIVHPVTYKKVLINSKSGINILKKYFNILYGGASKGNPRLKTPAASSSKVPAASSVISKRDFLPISYELNASLKYIYLGSNNASAEGLRHYFLIKLSEPIASLKDLLLRRGPNLNYLPIYVSSGANTGSSCLNNTCLIPFIGIITLKLPKYIICGPIAKFDYLKFFKNKSHRRINKAIDFFTNWENITNSDLYKQFPIFKTNQKHGQQYKQKIGSKYIFHEIIRYKKHIKNFIRKREFYIFDNLTFLNKFIGNYNILGINLHKLPSYYKECVKFSDLDLEQMHPYERLKLDHPNLNGKSTSSELHSLLKIIPIDKLKNIMNSPMIQSVKNNLYEVS